ncbi:glutathione S-transferase family protein [Alteromonas oceanisediminis]|uniref:glutathione S-transferase family protein n=1 Tax=Alteromonas oceanisediminis TaxID=2836180 RepID=UPI001BD99C73|nr:glutathione S-transferase family protein [Alteromonas oceanisediminis]MBT0586958.1 glutathione S-transferase family protein [Alteromonas oceanisediminis]
MLLYDTHTAPTPRRVRIFLAEKGIEIPMQQVDLPSGDNLSAEMRAKNPIGKVPILELDDGTCISESDAICTYFETLHPEPPLMGTTAIEKAQIHMWARQVEFGLFMQVGMCFQHTTGHFKDRMTPVPEYGKEAGINAKKFMSVLNRQLAKSEFIAGDQFTLPDIIALCAIDFARVVKIRIDEKHSDLQRWYNAVSTRPSASA